MSKPLAKQVSGHSLYTWEQEDVMILTIQAFKSGSSFQPLRRFLKSEKALVIGTNFTSAHSSRRIATWGCEKQNARERDDDSQEAHLLNNWAHFKCWMCVEQFQHLTATQLAVCVCMSAVFSQALAALVTSSSPYSIQMWSRVHAKNSSGGAQNKLLRSLWPRIATAATFSAADFSTIESFFFFTPIHAEWDEFSARGTLLRMSVAKEAKVAVAFIKKSQHAARRTKHKKIKCFNLETLYMAASKTSRMQHIRLVYWKTRM